MGVYVKIDFLEAMRLVKEEKSSEIYVKNKAGGLFLFKTREFLIEDLKDAEFYKYQEKQQDNNSIFTKDDYLVIAGIMDAMLSKVKLMDSMGVDINEDEKEFLEKIKVIIKKMRSKNII